MIPVQAKPDKIQALRGGAEHEILLLAEGILVVDSCWERVSFLYRFDPSALSLPVDGYTLKNMGSTNCT